jgi:hypothetical protein
MKTLRLTKRCLKETYMVNTQYYIIYVAQLVEVLATSRKVSASVSDEIIEFISIRYNRSSTYLLWKSATEHTPTCHCISFTQHVTV